ncbi:O-antigen polymerase [Ornithinibacillus halophilus]|uniref:Oligosaccharide repeat unit polymerase n=1 Tax=Ornithinibacillus halophilus TaxID=930117 RepID=A0A1M5GI94_9BACI|nr:O-antigen polymerase [Ornithinibacillus halophilus]SHG03429.1 oligosaccharide repeat unit polymerase [Ornithinibacillus halophilus]
MAFLLFLTCLVILIIGGITEKKIYSPIILFSALWAIILFFAQFELFGLTGTSYYTFLIIFIGLISYFGGYYFFRFIKPVKSVNYSSDIYIEKEWNFILKILILISLSVLVITSISSITLMIQGYSISDIRYIMGMGRFDSGIINILYAYITKPVTMLMIPISAYYFFGPQRNIKIMLLTISLVMLNVLTDGGRFILLYLLINFCLTLLIFKGKRKFRYKLRTKATFYLTFFISIAFIIYVTTIRGSSISETLYMYTVGAISHLSYRLDVIDNINIYTYGFSSLLGFIRPGFIIFEKLGYPLPGLVNNAERLNMELEEAVLIGDGVRFNAFTTLFYNFYIDLGLIGVFLGSFLFGVISYITYRNFMIRMNLLNFTIYLLIAQSLLTSMVRFQFSKFSFALCFIYIILITIQVRVKKQAKTNMFKNNQRLVGVYRIKD